MSHVLNQDPTSLMLPTFGGDTAELPFEITLVEDAAIALTIVEEDYISLQIEEQ